MRLAVIFRALKPLTAVYSCRGPAKVSFSSPPSRHAPAAPLVFRPDQSRLPAQASAPNGSAAERRGSSPPAPGPVMVKPYSTVRAKTRCADVRASGRPELERLPKAAMWPCRVQISTRNPTSMMASWGILKKSGARLAIRLRNEKIAKDAGSIDDPASRRTMVSCAM
jgi:hypothetical protein